MGWGDKIVVAFLSVPSKGVTDRRKHPHWVPPVNPTLQQDATPSAKTGNTALTRDVRTHIPSDRHIAQSPKLHIHPELDMAPL